MRLIDAGESVMVSARNVRLLLATVCHARRKTDERLRPEVAGAIHDIWTSTKGMPAGDTAWLLDAESLWWLHHAADALMTYDLDETAEESYEHPAVKAEIETMELLTEQAPITDRGLSAVASAEIELVLAEHRESGTDAA